MDVAARIATGTGFPGLIKHVPAGWAQVSISTGRDTFEDWVGPVVAESESWISLDIWEHPTVFPKGRGTHIEYGPENA